MTPLPEKTQQLINQLEGTIEHRTRPPTPALIEAIGNTFGLPGFRVAHQARMHLSLLTAQKALEVFESAARPDIKVEDLEDELSFDRAPYTYLKEYEKWVQGSRTNLLRLSQIRDLLYRYLDWLSEENVSRDLVKSFNAVYCCQDLTGCYSEPLIGLTRLVAASLKSDAEFWDWWIKEAIPQAWNEATKIHSVPNNLNDTNTPLWYCEGNVSDFSWEQIEEILRLEEEFPLGYVENSWSSGRTIKYLSREANHDCEIFLQRLAKIIQSNPKPFITRITQPNNDPVFVYYTIKDGKLFKQNASVSRGVTKALIMPYEKHILFRIYKTIRSLFHKTPLIKKKLEKQIIPAYPSFVNNQDFHVLYSGKIIAPNLEGEFFQKISEYSKLIIHDRFQDPPIITFEGQSGEAPLHETFQEFLSVLAGIVGETSGEIMCEFFSNEPNQPHIGVEFYSLNSGQLLWQSGSITFTEPQEVIA